MSRDVLRSQPQSWPALLLSLMIAMTPALGYPGEELLQDTLKSILVSFFTLAAAFAFFLARRKSGSTLAVHAILLLPLTLMLYALGSMAWSHAYLGGVEAVRWFLFAMIVFLGLNAFTLERATHLAWGIHLGAVIASLWAALQFWFDFNFFAQGPNPASTFVNRNFFAEFAVCTLPFSALLLTRVRDKTTVFFLIFSLGFNISALMMTGTRSALLGLILLAVLIPCILFWCRRRFESIGWRPAHVIAAVALLVASAGMLGSIDTNNKKVVAESGRGDALDRAFKRTLSMVKKSEYSQGSFSVRALMWKETGNMIHANPVTGVGAGAWEVQVPLYQASGSQLETDYYAHNEFLQLIAEYGLMGWIFLFALMIYLLWAARTTWSDQTPEGQREAPLRALVLCSLLVFLIVSNAGFAWRMATTGALFALCLAILVASDLRLHAPGSQLWRHVPWTAWQSKFAMLLTAIFVAIATYITQQAVESEAKIIKAIKIALSISVSGRPTDPQWGPAKKETLRLVKEGISINPHHRKLAPVVADAMAQWGDWESATAVWESVLESRPYVVIILSNVARGHIHAGNFQKAQQYLARANRLQPTAASLASLEVMLWSRTGKDQDAIRRTRELFKANVFDHDLIQAAYSLGLRNRDPELARQALILGIQAWPAKAADGWLKLGDISNAPDTKDEAKALQAYQAAMDVTAPAYKDAIFAKIPPAYQKKIR